LIGSAKGQAWYPSRHAAATGASRDALDEPLNQLRAAGLVRIAEWKRGSGQGYVLTPAGESTLAAGGEIPLPAVDPETTSEFAPASPPNPAQPDPPWPVVVTVLFVLNLLWFIVGLVLALRAGLPIWPFLTEGNIDIAHRTGAVYGYDLIRGEWWRLLSACFVHGNGAHILLNLFALILVGPLAEDLWGRRRLIIIYILSGLAGTCLAMILAPASMQAGAS
jgi:membrane associated rhomboid family serine protease